MTQRINQFLLSHWVNGGIPISANSSSKSLVTNHVHSHIGVSRHQGCDSITKWLTTVIIAIATT